MGMFDYVIIRTECPFCRKMITGFQTKDGNQNFDKLTPEQVNRFYTTCPNCRKWVEFNRKVSGEYYVPIQDILKDFELEKSQEKEARK